MLNRLAQSLSFAFNMEWEKYFSDFFRPKQELRLIFRFCKHPTVKTASFCNFTEIN